LIDFLIFAISKEIAWEEMFTIDTLEAFRTYSGFKNAPRAIINLSQYLFTHGRIDQPIQIHKPNASLPDIYEHYLLYQEQKVSSDYLTNVRRLLRSFHHYLENQGITLCNISIDHLDAFMATFKVKDATRRVYCQFLRGFLKYLYYEKGIVKKDYAPLLVGPRRFDHQKPPKFLRPKEVKKLFLSLTLSSPTDIRTYAMVHLAYALGLRPVEISKITFDDISFNKRELALPERKADNPIIMPLPDSTIKAVAAYVLKARPKSTSRYIFLSFHFPYRPVSAHTVLLSISRAMKKAGLPSSSYWLRHTYAQNLLQMGHTIREIKEMLGHDSIDSTRRYLSIHTEMMRKVLFDEEL
ncbi:MAG: tyrosine-type recombinase/integrase, partial [Candidatus Thorarchaeota archaeon]